MKKEIVISISRNGLLKSCARFFIERSETRKKQHDFKSVHFESRMVLFLYVMGEKLTLVDFFSIECRKVKNIGKEMYSWHENNHPDPANNAEHLII